MGIGEGETRTEVLTARLLDAIRNGHKDGRKQSGFLYSHLGLTTGGGSRVLARERELAVTKPRDEYQRRRRKD